MGVGATDLMLEGEETLGRETVEAIIARSPVALFWRRLRKDKVAFVALGVIVFLIVVAICAPLVVKLFGAPGPNVQDKKALDPNFGTATGPRSGHPFGVGPDGVGEDVFSRTIYGLRVSLEVALVSTGLSALIGVVVGLVAGYYRGIIDTLLSRFVDIILAFPVLLLAIGVSASCSLGKNNNGCLPANGLGRDFLYVAAALAIGGLLVTAVRAVRARGSTPRGQLAGLRGLGIVVLALVGVGLLLRFVVGSGSTLIKPGVVTVIFVIALVNWTYIARIVRGQVLSLREKEFVEAARSLGASDGRIIFRHLLPNLVAPLIVYTSLLIPQNILFEAALSFLGVGATHSQSSLGELISSATQTFDTEWWFLFFPGVTLVIIVLAFNLVGDGLQDALNPRTAR